MFQLLDVGIDLLVMEASSTELRRYGQQYQYIKDIIPPPSP